MTEFLSIFHALILINYIFFGFSDHQRIFSQAGVDVTVSTHQIMYLGI